MKFFENLKHYDVILGSQSPRRKELLQLAGIPFRVMTADGSEEFPRNMPPHEVVLNLCREKSNAFEAELKNPSVIVITADTIVVNNGMIVNKPADEKQALEMLESLNNGWHQVLTGVCIRHKDVIRQFYEITEVRFRNLSTDEILYYIKHYKPFDKAGAYGIQEWIGYVGISRILGSYSNVMGLPVERVYMELKSLVLGKD